MDDYGLETVQEYMYHIRANAESSVRNLLRDVAKRAGTNVLTAVDYLDDGSPVRTFVFPIHCYIYLNISLRPDSFKSGDQRGGRLGSS